MAKKGKKKGKKSNKENLAVFREAILSYQLQIKGHSLIELEKELIELNTYNKRLMERNAKLKEEQFANFQVLLQQSKDLENEEEQNQIYNYEHVERALKEKWEVSRKEEIIIDELVKRITDLNEECEKTVKQVTYWSEYKDVGKHEHQTQIKLLETELEDMKKNYDEMCAHLNAQLDAARGDILAKAENRINEQKSLATEKALKQLDKKSLQEVQENKWLHTEEKTHREEEAILEDQIRVLEQKNLKIISELLQCQQEDLKISTNFCLNKLEKPVDFSSKELRMNLENMSIYQTEYQSPSTSPSPDCPCNSMPITHEEKVFAQDDIELEIIENQEKQIDLHGNNEFLHLGALEVKLLQVSGQSKPIYSMNEQQIEKIEEENKEAFEVKKWKVDPALLV